MPNAALVEGSRSERDLLRRGQQGLRDPGRLAQGRGFHLPTTTTGSAFCSFPRDVSDPGEATGVLAAMRQCKIAPSIVCCLEASEGDLYTLAY